MDYQLIWFDTEMKAILGIDVFEHPFDKEGGYSIIKQDNIELLLLKVERLSKLEPVIGEFVGAPHFRLLRANEADDTPLKYLYKNVKDNIKIPEETLTELYKKSNTFMDHFYTEEEKDGFYKKWSRDIEFAHK